MRTTKVSDADVPLADPRAGGSGQLTGVTAKLSLCLGLFAFLLNNFSASPRFQLSYGARLGIVIVCAVLILAGVALAVVAVRAYCRHPRPGVIGFLGAAVIVNAVLLVMLVIGVIRTMTQG